MLFVVIRIFFQAYALLLFLRVAFSWFPSLQNSHLFSFLFWVTEPYLKIFRRILPPIGGQWDLSPIVGFFALQILEHVLLRFLR